MFLKILIKTNQILTNIYKFKLHNTQYNTITGITNYQGTKLGHLSYRLKISCCNVINFSL